MPGEGGGTEDEICWLLAATLHSPALTASHVAGVIFPLVKSRTLTSLFHKLYISRHCVRQEDQQGCFRAKAAHSGVQHPLTSQSRVKGSGKIWVCVVVTTVSFLL